MNIAPRLPASQGEHIMPDNFSGPAPGRRPRTGFALGDRVRITSGELAGLTGVVTRLSARPDCVLIVDGWPDGVYLNIIGEGLGLLESATSPDRAQQCSLPSSGHSSVDCKTWPC